MSARWPVAQDYNEAMQAPALCFADEELRGGEVKTNLYGLPRQRSGAFASVFQVACARRICAVRCFLRRMDSLEERYLAMARHFSAHRPACLADFTFLVKGINVKGEWFPVLKMPWLEGRHLDAWIRSHLAQPEAIRRLAGQWLLVLDELRGARIAHGDLQHGNILVDAAGRIHLVDYDGAFVPSLIGLPIPEQGHRNYQHPGRTQAVFGPQLDHFSGWVIYFSLLAISENPSLWQAHGDGDDALLLKQHDLLNPGRTRVWADLDRHFFQEKSMAVWLRDFLQTPVENIPPVSATISADWQRDLPWWLGEPVIAPAAIAGWDDQLWQPNAAFTSEVRGLLKRAADLAAPALDMPDPMQSMPPAVQTTPLPPDLRPTRQVIRHEWSQSEIKAVNWLFYLCLALLAGILLYGLLHEWEPWPAPVIAAMGAILGMANGPRVKRKVAHMRETIAEEENPDYLWHLEQRQAAEQAATSQLRDMAASTGAFHEEFPGRFDQERDQCARQLEGILLRLQTAPDERHAEQKKRGPAAIPPGLANAATTPEAFASQLRARGAVQQVLQKKRLFFASVPDWEEEFRARVDQQLDPETAEMEYIPIPFATPDWREEDKLMLGQARAAAQKFEAWLERQITTAKWEDARLLTAIWTTAKTRADLKLVENIKLKIEKAGEPS